MFYDPNYDIEKDEQVQSQLESLQDEISMRNIDEISIGAASFSTFNHDRSMTTLNLERDHGNNKTPLPGSRLSNRSKLSNASKSVAGEGSSVNNILLDDYGNTDVKTKKINYKHRTANKKHLHSKKRS